MIEVRSIGGYLTLSWRRNGVVLSTNIVDFGETYFADDTSMADIGFYTVQHSPLTGQRRPEVLEITVIEPGIAISNNVSIYIN